MSFKVTSEITGLADLLATLHGLKRGVRNRVLRPAIDKAVRIVAKRVKTLAPVAAQTYARRQSAKEQGLSAAKLNGIVKKAITSKVIVTRAGLVIGKVGAKKGIKVRIGTVTRGKNKGQPIMQSPSRILHLIEKGHGGPHPAPAHSFLRKGFDESKGEAAAAFQAAAAAGIAKMIARRGK